MTRCHSRLTRVHHLPPKVRRPFAPSDTVEPKASVCRGAREQYHGTSGRAAHCPRERKREKLSSSLRPSVCVCVGVHHPSFAFFFVFFFPVTRPFACVCCHTHSGATRLGPAQPSRGLHPPRSGRLRTTLCTVNCDLLLLFFNIQNNHRKN